MSIEREILRRLIEYRTIKISDNDFIVRRAGKNDKVDYSYERHTDGVTKKISKEEYDKFLRS